jgi:replicative DNA helicase
MADILPPHNVEAEEAVLGSLMIDPEAALRIAPFLKPEMFYIVKNGWIYDAILKLQERHEAIDLLTVSAELERDNRLGEIGGQAYIAQMTSSVPTALNVDTYAHLVEDMHTRRRMIQAASEVARIAYDQTVPVPQVIEKSEAAVFAVSEGKGDGGMVPMRRAVNDFFERIEYLHEHRDEPLGIPTGYPDLDKITGGMNKGDLIIVAARPGVGKCVSADTKLVDPTSGALVTIEQMVKRQHATLLTLTPELKFAQTQPSAFVDDGFKPVYRVTTSLGREIDVTLSHPFLTVSGWKSLGLLNTGDAIAVPRVVPVFGDCAAPDHEPTILAYLLADGCMTGRNPMFTNSNPKLRDDFAQAALKFAGTKVRVEKGDATSALNVYVSGDGDFINLHRAQFAQRLTQCLHAQGLTQKAVAKQLGVLPTAVWDWVHAGSVPTQEHFAALCQLLGAEPHQLAPQGWHAISEKGVNSLTAWLMREGVWGKNAATKFIPESVFRYTRQTVALFLNRLFACDGSVFLSSGRATISYSTVSLRLAREVQHLLLRFGILAKLRSRSIKYKDERRQAYELQITHRPSLLTFFDEIGALGKEAAIEQARVKLLQAEGNANLDVIPAEVWLQIEQTKGERSWRSLTQALGLGEDGNLHVGKRGIGRERLLAIARELKSEPLEALATSEVYWDRITAIEPLGEKQVYDLTVPETHNFVANDVVVHNSSLMLNLAYNAAYKYRQRVAIFSLEMGVEQLVQRFVASETGIDSQRLRVGDLRDDEWASMTKVSMQMADLMVFLDDTPSLTPLDLRVKSRRIYQEYGLDLIIVDYLQLMTSENSGRGGGENRVQEISHISRNLKQIARELKVPLIAGSQLSRLVEQRSDKRPMLSDLRESGSIEQDADIVSFIYRDEIYNPDTDQKNIAEISVQKNRNGPTGKMNLFFDKRLTSFKNLAREKIEL